MVVSTLKSAGHEVIDWAPYKAEYAHALVSSVYSSDGDADVLASLKESGETLTPT